MESSSIAHPAKAPQHPVWEVPTLQDRQQPRTIWRRIFPSWKGNSCQPPYPKTNSAAPAIDIASTRSTSTPPPPPPPPTSTTSGNNLSSPVCSIDHNTIRTPRMGPELPSNSDGSSIAPIPPPVAPLLPPVHQSTASSSNITTTTTITSKSITNSTNNTTLHPSTPVVVTSSNKVLPPQSPRMERPPKLPPSQHQPQRSLTVSLPQPQPPATFIAATNTGSSAVISSGSQPPPPLQHRPTAVTNLSSQRNLSFSSTGSRHRRSSGDWPILTSLQQISLAPPPEDGFDAQSFVTMEPYHHADALPAPPPPPPPVTLIDQPKCERRISILSDFDDNDDDDDDNDRDDDHLFDLSSDEDDDDDEGNAAFHSGNQVTQKQAAVSTKTSPISFTYSSGNKSADTCSVSPTTVILPPPPPPLPPSSSSVTDAPDWMLEWAASTSVSGIDTPKALVDKTKYDDQLYTDTEHIEQKNDIKNLQQPFPSVETETASCSTSSTDEISLSASDRTATSEFVYLPMEPMPTRKKPDANANQRVLFCAGWAVVLFDDVVTNRTPCDSTNHDAYSSLLLPEQYNYDESIYYIELLQGGILRCTSMVGRKDEIGTPNTIEMSICRNGASIVPVSPATAGACLELRYTTIHHWSVTNEKRSNGPCYILPVNITTRTMDRIATSRAGPKNSSGNHKSRHHYWLQPQPVVKDESENVTGVDETTEHHKTPTLLDTEYAPQAQHDAVVFLRFAFDAALQSSHV